MTEPQSAESGWVYWMPEEGEGEEDARSMGIPGGYTAERVAEEAAQLEYNDSGFDLKFPIQIIVKSPHDPAQQFTVDVDYDPYFTAVKNA